MRFHRAGTNVARGNLLEVQTGTPPFRYNSTPEQNIRLEGNSLVPEDRFRPPRPDEVNAGPPLDVRAQLHERWE